MLMTMTMTPILPPSDYKVLCVSLYTVYFTIILYTVYGTVQNLIKDSYLYSTVQYTA